LQHKCLAPELLYVFRIVIRQCDTQSA